jgi:hypothetical protein
MTAERPGHRCTTRHAQAIYPFVATGGLGGRGVFVGRDSSGGAFCYDPWVLYGDGSPYNKDPTGGHGEVSFLQGE